jgi:hypothetical protein
MIHSRYIGETNLSWHATAGRASDNKLEPGLIEAPEEDPMTPQERQLITELFDRLASLERNPRDPDAEAAIREGLRNAPNAIYALVQTVLVQDEALKAANARIQQYEQGDGPGNSQPRGFLDSMRDSLFGRDEPRGSVPKVPQGGAPMGGPAGYRPDPGGRDRDGPPPTQQSYGAPVQQPYSGSPGGSFLGTAAAAAAGVIGGSLLMGGIRSALGGHQAGPFSSAFDHLSGSPGSSAAGSDLSREAGLNDIGGRSTGPFDQRQQDAADDTAADAQDDTDVAQDDAQDAGDDVDSDTA